MPIKYWINKINFKTGLQLDLKPDSIIVFVGPNNSGKTKTLKEILMKASGHHTDYQIINDLEITAEGTAEEFLDHIKERKQHGSSTYIYPNQNNNSGMDGNSLSQYWNRLLRNKTAYSSATSSFFVRMIGTGERLTLVAPPSKIDTFSELQSHPIHQLMADQEKELTFSQYFQLAFGKEVVLNHAAGKILPLHVGTRPISSAEHDRVSHQYQNELRKLPLLNEQGDGMRSFAGVFLSLFAENYMVNLVDEPEAFLHPPQASLLGQLIGKNMPEDKQLFVATHSEHFLKGLLDTSADRLIVVRIQRDNSTNKVNVLSNHDIKQIWSDSLLRFSNVLDGLFHKRVILVESDSDCRFYAAMVASIVENERKPSPDILFIQSGGKHRFPVAVKALNKLEVPITIIGDFDLYHEEQPLRALYEEMGGEWDDIKDDFLIVKRSIDQKVPQLKRDDLEREIEGVFSSFSDTIVPELKIKAIKEALKKSSPWSQAKSSGAAYLTAGDVTTSFRKVQTKLREKSIQVLEIGEIEAFDKTIGGHGPRWVNAVLVKNLLIDPELEDARKFVKKEILSL